MYIIPEQESMYQKTEQSGMYIDSRNIIKDIE